MELLYPSEPNCFFFEEKEPNCFSEANSIGVVWIVLHLICLVFSFVLVDYGSDWLSYFFCEYLNNQSNVAEFVVTSKLLCTSMRLLHSVNLLGLLTGSRPLYTS
jgi:hypothetical protein